MSVEIWKGVCNASLLGRNPQDTEVTAYPERGRVRIYQAGDCVEEEATVVLGEAEAIDIALCILAELAPGMFYNLKKDD